MSPVVYIVFNRPHLARASFAAIREYRPSDLFVVADGPRQDNASDASKCAQVREILDEVDWPCRVHRAYSDTNMGPKQRISSGLDWALSIVDRVIVLEDDCIPSPDFFRFCDALLDRYQNDDRVWGINGNGYHPEHRWGDGAYYFSKYPDTMGWATWRRAWRYYRGDLPFLDAWLDSPRWAECFPLPAERKYWRRIFKRVQHDNREAWDYPWVGCTVYHGGLIATPNANLVQNVGFGFDATHTRMQDEAMTWDVGPLGEMVHPSSIKANEAADKLFFERFFSVHMGFKRLLRYASLAIKMLKASLGGPELGTNRLPPS